MALDVTADRTIGEAYNDLRRGTLSWLILGYSRDGGRGPALMLQATGNDGLEGLRNALTPNDVLFGLLRLDERILLWSQVPHAVGGVKRARALVHARTLSSSFRAHNGAFNAASPDDFQLTTIENNLLNGSPSLRSPQLGSGFSSPPTQHPSPDQSQIQSPRSPFNPSTSQFTSPSPLSSQFSSRRPSASQQSSTPQPTPISDRFETTRRPSITQVTPSALPAGVVGGVSDLSIREHAPPRTTSPLQDQPPSSFSQHPRGFSSSPPPIPATEPLNVPHRRPSVVAAGYPAGLGAPVSSPPPPSSASDAAAPSRIYPQRKASLSYSQGRSQRNPTSPPSAQTPSSPPPSSSANWQHPRMPARDQSSTSLTSTSDDGGLFSSAAAAMLAPSTPDPNPSSSSNLNLDSSPTPNSHLDHDDSPRSPVETPIYNNPRFAGVVASSAASARPSVQSFPASVVPEDEDDDEEEEERRREEEEEERVRAEAEREREVAREAEEAEERRLREEEAARAAAIAQEEARLAVEARRQRDEAERIRLEAERVAAEEAERVRLAEEEERTRQAEEEMRLLIERQGAERAMREEEERRAREEERRREEEERRRVLLERRERGEVMLSGMVNVQGGDSMLWKRRHFKLSTAGLMLYKSDLETDHPLDTIPLVQIAVREFGVEDSPVPNSFKIVLLRDDDEIRFYTGEKGEKDRLFEAVKLAARLS